MAYRFFGVMENNALTLSSEDFFHLTKVLRSKPAEIIEIVYDNKLHKVTLENYATKQFVVHESLPLLHELGKQITLIYALPKGDKLDLVLKGAVELGVHHIILISTQFTITKIAKAKEQERLLRYTKILKSAAMQAKRDYIPTISGVLTLTEALKTPYDLRLIANETSGPEDEALFVTKVKDAQTISILVGSEGGFSAKEIKEAHEASYLDVSFGPLIFRSETAALYGLSVLNFLSRTM